MSEEEKEQYVREWISNSDVIGKADSLSSIARVGIALGANYIETLNDREFVELLEATGMLTPEQAADIRIPYKQLTQEELAMDTRQAGWKAIKARQEEEEGIEP